MSERIIRFGVFELDLAANHLRKNGVRLKLQEQPFQVLAALLERPGEIVTREELKERLWSGDTFVDFDRGLNTAVNKIREALGDSAQQPRFVETLPKRGYRFVYPISPERTVPGPNRASDGRVRRRPGSLGFALILTAMAVTAGWVFQQDTEEPQPLTIAPLTALPGAEDFPSFSPDGTQVAFQWDRGGNPDVYVKAIGSEHLIPLTDDPAADIHPAWSPDGRWVAFLRHVAETKYELRLVPPLGGPSRSIAEVSRRHNMSGMERDLAWSPDSGLLAMPLFTGPGQPTAIFLVPANGGERRQITFPAKAIQGDTDPAFSFDGGRLAFVRRSGYNAEEIFVQRLDQRFDPVGEPDRLDIRNTSDLVGLWGPVWVPSGDTIIFTARSEASRSWSLWSVPASGGEAVPLPAVGHDVARATISQDGRRLAAVSGHNLTNIWKLNRSQATPEPLDHSTRFDAQPAFAPDGRRIAFLSARSGHLEIWRCDADGSNLLRLTSFEGPRTGSQSWSPKGKWLVFDAYADGTGNIWIASSDGGPSRQITHNPALDYIPTWSRDGELIYFSSMRSGDTQVWSIPFGDDKSTEAKQVTVDGGARAIESVDGGGIYYAKRPGRATSLWCKSFETGAEALILEGMSSVFTFSVFQDGIYYVAVDETGSGETIRYFDLRTGKSEQIAVVSDAVWGFDVSPDQKMFLWSQRDGREFDLLLVENFQ